MGWVLAWAAATTGATWVALWRLPVASSVNDEIPYRQAAAAMRAGDWTLNNQHPPLAKELIAVVGALGSRLGAQSLVADRLVGAGCFVLTGLMLASLASLASLATPAPATRERPSRAAGLLAALLWWALPLSPGVLVHHVDRYALLEGPMLTLAVATAVVAALVCSRNARSQALSGPAHTERRVYVTTWPGWRGSDGLAAWVAIGACLGAATACKLLGVLVAPVTLVPAVAAGCAVARLHERRRGRDAAGQTGTAWEGAEPDRIGDSRTGQDAARGPRTEPDRTGDSRTGRARIHGAALLAGAAASASRLAVAAVASLATFGATYLPMGTHAWPAVRTAVTFQLQHADTGHLQTVAGHNYLFPPAWAPLWFQGQYLHPAATLALWIAAALGAGAALARWRHTPGLVPVLAAAVPALAVALMSLKLPQYHDTVVPFLDVLAAAAVVALARVVLPGGSARSTSWAWRAGCLVLGAALLLPLALRAREALVDLAHLQPGDYRVAADILQTRHVTGPVVVWGDAAALAAQGYPVTTTATLPADCRPPALVTDATSIHRLPVDVPRWRRTCGAGYQRMSIGRVTVYLAPTS